jgi:hypothetical protein
VAASFPGAFAFCISDLFIKCIPYLSIFLCIYLNAYLYIE